MSDKQDATDKKGPADKQWGKIQDYLREEFGKDAYESWLKNLEFVALDNGTVTVAARTPFIRDWVRRHYAGKIRDFFAKENESVLAVEVITARDGVEQPSADGAGNVTANARASSKGVMDSFGAKLDPRYVFDSFVVGKC